MNALEMGTKWGESVSVLARKEFLKRAPGTESASALKLALHEGERDLPEKYVPFIIEDWSPVDEAWIQAFCVGVRSVRPDVKAVWG